MAGRYGEINYERYTKRGFLLGLGLFSIGVVGELAIHLGGVEASALLEALLFDAEIAGLLLMFFVPVIFGVILPLTE